MSRRLIFHGLDYQAAEIVINRYGFRGKKADTIFQGLQVMETAALAILNKSNN